MKSPPELWAELSEEEALGRHLAGLGPIRVTRVDPETTVAWEGDRTSGTVELSPSGWGTKVILTAQLPGDAVPGPEPAPQAASPRRFGRLRRLWRRAPAAPPEPEPEPVAASDEPSEDAVATLETLEGALDALGSAHHRPFSRG
ncbi:MAG TPA: hypothetical protein VK279_11785 [Solirubrobacteraceae bacterium]|nr:hypothetical protein [Solirubrobacteraceae bacterium]